jgi:cytochrome c oxidase cbb3-type subunit 3
MSSRFRNRLLAAALLTLLVGCKREIRRQDSQPLTGTPAISASPDTVFPGGAIAPPLVPRASAYEGNAAAIAQGQQLFGSMNCAGCHGHGGGGMGPPLMDAKWRYGGRIDQIASSISEGRPNGMPAWRSKLTQEQIWQLSAYVRSLAGLEPIDAVSARTDSMSNIPPQTQLTPKAPKSADSDQQ